MDATTVLIVDDHEVAREGLRAALGGDERFEIVGGAPNGRRALELARRTQPDVAIVDHQVRVLEPHVLDLAVLHVGDEPEDLCHHTLGRAMGFGRRSRDPGTAAAQRP